jgi:hypothetical protein
MPFHAENASFYQDRLATNIGKALKQRCGRHVVDTRRQRDEQQPRGSVSLSVKLSDLSSKGLKSVHPFNYASPQYGSNATVQ